MLKKWTKLRIGLNRQHFGIGETTGIIGSYQEREKMNIKWNMWRVVENQNILDDKHVIRNINFSSMENQCCLLNNGLNKTKVIEWGFHNNANITHHTHHTSHTQFIYVCVYTGSFWVATTSIIHRQRRKWKACHIILILLAQCYMWCRLEQKLYQSTIT